MPLNDLNKNEINLKDSEEIGWKEGFTGSTESGSKIYSKIDKISKPLFWALFVIFVLVAAGIGFYFYSYFLNRDIAFSLSAPQSVLAGVPFDIEAGTKNNFNNALNDVRISVILPEGTFFSGENKEKRFYDKSFGTLEKDANFQEKISIIALPGSQTLKKFNVKISYYTPALGAGSRFEQTKTVEVFIGESALRLDVIAPQKVLNNEDFKIEIHYRNMADINFSNVELGLNYPDSFIFKSSTIVPSGKNNTWFLGDLPKNGSEGSLVITGRVVSSDKSFFEIKGDLLAEISGQEYLISEKTAQLNIASSPLILSVSIGDKRDYIVSLRENLRYKISYRNSSDVGLNDVIITAKLTGEMFDFKTFSSNGFFDSKNNVITWNVANTSNLRMIGPGADGYVEFQIRTKEDFPIKRESDKNFVLSVAAEISSPTVPYQVSSDKTISFANLKNNVSGAVSISASALFYDPSSGINNKGQFPPKVNQPTNFTVHWEITNYSTDVSNIKVNAFLQSGVRWTGQVKSNINSLPSYDERTQEVVWNIDKILATKGIISSPVEAIFQVEATPNVIQTGTNMPLLGQTTIRASDDFNKINLMNFIAPLNIGISVAQ